MRLAFLLATVLAAGCVKPEAPPEQDAPPADVEALDAGGFGVAPLEVVALFADRTPLAGVNVTVANLSRLTDATGLARFEAVPVGTHTLLAQKAAHRSAQVEVTVVEGQRNAAEVVLAAEDGGQHAHKVGFEDHADEYVFQGRFDCSATYVIVTGDCLIVVENATGQAGLPDPVSNATTERNVVEFALDLNWTGLTVEMTWEEPGVPTSDGMTLALEPAEAPVDGHAAKYARADGGSPLRVDLVPGVKHESATLDDMPRPEGGEVLRVRAFVRGQAHHPAGQEVLGVGLARDIEFEIRVTVTYGEPA